MKQPIRIGFIGCGGHSSRHADVILRMPDDFKIVGAIDTKEGVAESFLASRNVHALATTEFSKLMAIEEMDAVLIGTPPKSHLDLCNKVLFFMRRRGTHIFCEKPLWEGPYQDEGRRIIEEATRRGIVFSSCHSQRYEREFVYVKAYLPTLVAKYGKPLEVRFQFFYHEPSTEWKRKEGESLLLDHMNHEIDLVHFLFGHGPAKFWRLSDGFDQYQVAGKTMSGLKIWFSGYRRLKSHTFRNELEIVFEAGRMRVESVLDSETGIVEASFSSFPFNKKTVESDKPYNYNFRPYRHDDSLEYIMKNFAAAIRGTESCYLTCYDLVTNTSICNELVAYEYAAI